MTGQGGFARQPYRRLRAMLIAQLVWIALVFTLGGWWLKLALRQAARINELELATGIAAHLAESRWEQTQRMLLGESITFFCLLLASTGCLAWLYWRDAKRTRALQGFFASLTHELRTPLTSIRLQAESIAETLPPQSHEQGLLRKLLEDCLRIESQVDRSLELARIEGGGPVYTHSLEARPLIERIVRGYPGKLELETRLGPGTVQADPTTVQVIFRNLLENAIRHSDQTPVRVKIWSEARTGGRLAVLVEDNGRGNAGDPRSLGQLFEKGPRSQGAGVGLYLIRVLMERMGGAIEFPATGGPGFRIVLLFREGAPSGG